jgi:hypothetical protein
MRQLTIPTWVPPDAKAALDKLWNDASRDLHGRALLRRLASNCAMREVWRKLPAEPADGAEWLIRGAIAYAHRGFELRYSPPGPGEPKLALGDPMPWQWRMSDVTAIPTRFLLATMRGMAHADATEGAWARVRGEDCASDFKSLVAAVERLPQLYAWWDQQCAPGFDTLPTVARPQSKGARLRFFCKGMERRLREVYQRPLYDVIAILAQVVFDRVLDPDTVKKMCKRK